MFPGCPSAHARDLCGPPARRVARVFGEVLNGAIDITLIKGIVLRTNDSDILCRELGFLDHISDGRCSFSGSGERSGAAGGEDDGAFCESHACVLFLRQSDSV